MSPKYATTSHKRVRSDCGRGTDLISRQKVGSTPTTRTKAVCGLLKAAFKGVKHYGDAEDFK